MNDQAKKSNPSEHEEGGIVAIGGRVRRDFTDKNPIRALFEKLLRWLMEEK